MKKIGGYTCKGKITSADIGPSPKRIILFDGKFTTGYRIVGFDIAPSDMDNESNNVYVGKLTTDSRGGVGAKDWDWDSNFEMAWATVGFDANNPGSGTATSWIDPDNLIIEDLYLYTTSGGDLEMNYMITLEKYSFSDWRGALAMVRNSSQE